MSDPKQAIQINLPILGMSCSNCTSHVETALRKLPGVANVRVDLEKKQASLAYDPSIIDLVELQNAIQKTGYSVPIETVMLQITGMSCVSCLAHVEGALQSLSGVTEANASLSQRSAQVQFIPGVVTPVQMIQAVQEAGYQAQYVEGKDENGCEHKTVEKNTAQPTGDEGLLAWIKRPFTRPANRQN